MPLTRTGKWTVLYAAVTVELAALYGTYRVWDNLNNKQGYRRWMLDHHPRVLEVFYWSCGLAGVHNAKDRDFKDWSK